MERFVWGLLMALFALLGTCLGQERIPVQTIGERTPGVPLSPRYVDVTVYDIETGDPVQGANVRLGGLPLQFTTDQQGTVRFPVPAQAMPPRLGILALTSANHGPASVEVSIPSGGDYLHWAVGVAPAAAYLKTPLINNAVGTGATPVTLTGTVRTSRGVLPVTITVSVPPGFLFPSQGTDASFWIYPRGDVFMFSNSGGGGDPRQTLIQLQVEVRDPAGKQLAGSLAAPVTITATPWFPAALGTGSGLAALWRFNEITLGWDLQQPPQPPVYDLGRGWVVFSTSQFSTVAVSIPPSGSGGTTPPAVAVTNVTYNGTVIASTSVTCGCVAGTLSGSIGKGSTVVGSQALALALKAAAKGNSGELAALIAQVSGELGIEVEFDSNGNITSKTTATISNNLAAGAKVGGECYSGNVWFLLLTKQVTISLVVSSATVDIPIACVQEFCLKRDPQCHTSTGQDCGYGGDLKYQLDDRVPYQPGQGRSCPGGS